MRRRVVVVAIIIGAGAALALVVRQVWLHDTAREVSTDEAVQRFRDHVVATLPTTLPTTSPATVPVTTVPTQAQAQALPEPGVYRYTTTGGEQVDTLGGADHTYPVETTITVTREDCGVRLRWDVLRERHEEWRLCLGPDGVRLQTTGTSFHEFFRHGQLEQLVCARDAVLVPADHRPRKPVAMGCHLDADEYLPAYEVLDTGTRTVEGAAVAVTHVRMTVEMPGPFFEHTTFDYWLDDHGLPVWMAEKKISRSAAEIVGSVTYTEEFTAALTSLTPLK